MEFNNFAIWTQLPNSLVAGNLPQGDTGNIGISLRFIVTDIPTETSTQDVIEKLSGTKFYKQLDQSENPDETVRCGFENEWPIKWPLNNQRSEPTLQLEVQDLRVTGLVITWKDLK